MAGDTIIRRGKATISVTGLGTLYARLRRVAPDAQQAGIEILNAAGARAFAASQADVPVDEKDGGQLKASGRFYKARVSKRSGRVTATIGYGGARLAKLAPGDNPIYAIVQHEDLAIRHQHGSAKYLERPATREKQGLLSALGSAIGRAIGR